MCRVLFRPGSAIGSAPSRWSSLDHLPPRSETRLSRNLPLAAAPLASGSARSYRQRRERFGSRGQARDRRHGDALDRRALHRRHLVVVWRRGPDGCRRSGRDGSASRVADKRRGSERRCPIARHQAFRSESDQERESQLIGCERHPQPCNSRGRAERVSGCGLASLFETEARGYFARCLSNQASVQSDHLRLELTRRSPLPTRACGGCRRTPRRRFVPTGRDRADRR